MSLSRRILLSMIALVTVFGALMALVGGYLLRRQLDQEAANRVCQDLNAAREFYNHHLRRLEDTIRYTVQEERFRDALRAGDTAYLAARLDRIRTADGLDLLYAADAMASVVYRAHRPELAGGSLADCPLVRHMLVVDGLLSGTVLIPMQRLKNEAPELAARATIPILPTPRARPAERKELAAGMALAAAIPVHDASGVRIGLLWAGVLLNRNYELVDQVRGTVFRAERYGGRFLGTATIFQDDVRISTNVLQADGSRGIGTRVSAEVHDFVLGKGNVWVGPAWVVNDWYISAYAPIRDVTGRSIGMIYVGVLQEKYARAALRTFGTFLLLTLAAALVALTVAWRLGAGISRPVRKLVDASAAIAAGDLSQELPVASPDEIGALTETFNTMVHALRERDARLREQTRQQLTRSERLAAVGRLAGGVAHEINNPLTGVLTFAHLLLRDAPANSRQREDLQTIIDATTRCRDIVRGLLDFARQNEPRKKMSDLNHVLQQSLTLTQNQARLCRIEIRRDLAPGLPLLLIDPNQIAQVAVNMIVNAVDAMPAGGVLTLATRAVTDGDRPGVEFEVTDTGCGIPPENLERIFDPFFTTKPTGQGTGLGLAVSYGIVTEHGGTIRVSSRSDHGTTMTVRLPVLTEERLHDA